MTDLPCLDIGSRVKVFYKNSADLPRCMEGTVLAGNLIGFLRLETGKNTYKQVATNCISVVEEMH